MTQTETNPDIKSCEQITPKFISLEKIIASKSRTLYKIIPKFVLNQMKKLIHLDEINAAIYKYRDKHGVDFANAILNELQIKVIVNNPENVPHDGRPIVVANHPIGSVDGMALISVVGQNRKDILFPVNDILCHLPGLKTIFIPINKYGANSSNYNTLNKAFEGNDAIMFFPAGTESKIIEHKLQDFPWKKTFVKEAQKYNREIVPVYIEGQNGKGFYRLFKLRRFFGVKFDLEMILLPREMFRQRGKTIELTFGKPIEAGLLDNKHHAKIWADKIRSHVYRLKQDKDAVFDPES